MALRKTTATRGSSIHSGVDESDLDALYGAPLKTFTHARDELAKRLRKSGDKPAAVRVKALRRPSVAAWTLNRMAQTAPEHVDALLRAGQRLREAQRRALGPGGAGALREAGKEHRAVVNEILRAASKILREGGYPSEGVHLDRVRDSLLAAPTARESDLRLLERGRLTSEIEPGDLSEVLAMLGGATGSGGPDAGAAHEPEANAKAATKPRLQAATKPRPSAAAKPRPDAEAKPVQADARRAAKELRAEQALARKQSLSKKRAAERAARQRAAEQGRVQSAARKEAQSARTQAGREAARTAKEAMRRTQEAARLSRDADKAEDTARAARERAADASRAAAEAQKLAADAARTLDAAEDRLERLGG